MKPKMSLGSGKIKRLVLKHVEKVLVAFALLCFVLLVYSASKLGGDFDLQPDELQTASVEADKSIRAPKKGPSSEVPPWEKISDEIKTHVPAWPYGIENPWMHKLFPGETLRGKPAVFPLEELRASTGFGGIATSASAGLRGGGAMDSGGSEEYAMEMGGEGGYGGYGTGGKAVGHRWVVVTGLLPYRKQWAEYGNVFRNAEVKDARRDVPSYSYYDVERAEITPGVEPKEDAWKPLRVFSEIKKVTGKWAGSKPEIVNRKFLHRSAGVVPMAYPLPPLAGTKTFGPEIAHEPEIPLYYEPERKVEVKEIDWEALEDDPEALSKAKAMARGGTGGQYGTSSGMYGEEGGMSGGSEDAYMQDYGEEMGSGFGMSGGYDMGMGSGMTGMMGRRREIPEYQLYRFFDFSVLPGHYYQYRVRLRLANPNRELPVQALEDETLADDPFLLTDWSVNTSTVNVPLDSRVLAGPVMVSNNITVMPKAELGTVFFNADDGEEVAQKHDVITRGRLMNFFGVKVEEQKPAASAFASEYGGYGEEMGSEMMYGEGASPAKKKKKTDEEIRTVDYVTEMLVLDFDGGGSLPGPDRNLKGPGRVLLMDPAGNLVLQDELLNQEEWFGFFPPEVKKKKPDKDPMGEGMYGEEYGSEMMGEY